MRRPALYRASITLLALALASCTQAAPDILVLRDAGGLVVDIPRSGWWIFGRRDRTICVSQIQLFDRTRTLWSADAIGKESWQTCAEKPLPLRLGVTTEDFVSPPLPPLKTGQIYGLAIDGYTRVDFRLQADGTPINITEWEKWFDAPCDSRWARDEVSQRCPRRLPEAAAAPDRGAQPQY